MELRDRRSEARLVDASRVPSVFMVVLVYVETIDVPTD